MKAVVLGASGQLGWDLVQALEKQRFSVTSVTHSDIELTDVDSVMSVLRELRPGVILNAAALTDVPGCEKDPLRAFAVNAQGALHVAKAAEELQALNVYYSTDYVFDGQKTSPYVESDAPSPLNVYGASKLTGEFFTNHYSRKGIVIRVSGIYGRMPSRGKGTNFVKSMIKLAKELPIVRVVFDEVLSPTFTQEVAEKTPYLISRGEYGVFHLASEGGCSWYEFATTLFDALSIKTPIEAILATEFKSEVRRPKYSALMNERYNADPSAPRMLPWRHALLKFLASSNSDLP